MEAMVIPLIYMRTIAFPLLCMNARKIKDFELEIIERSTGR